MGPDDEIPRPNRTSPQALLTDWFEKAYTQRDTALYREMLDGEFEFEFIEQDADCLRTFLGSSDAWGRALDLQSTRALFEATIVDTIALDISIFSEAVFTNDGCDSCRLILSTVALRIGTTETISGTPRVLSVNSPQVFIVRRDSTIAGEWLLFRQQDLPRGERLPKDDGNREARGIYADEASSWGKVKGLFLPEQPINPLTCSISGSLPSGWAPHRVEFAATFSGGHGPYTVSWEFGDGGASTGLNSSHTFRNPGGYSTILTVSDSQAPPEVCRDTLDIVAIERPPSRLTAEDLLTDWFEIAYSRQDSVLYEEMLDGEFEFQFLPEDADDLRDILGLSDSWGESFDLRSAGRLFRSPTVTDVTLDIAVNSNEDYPGEDCIACRQIDANVTLRVDTTLPPEAPITLAVDSPQSFIVKMDPLDTSKWVLWRQIDRPRGLRGGEMYTPTVATENTSWGRVKGMYY